jgi:exonuclease III
MKLKLMIQNVQGLNDPQAVARVSNYYFPKLNKLDILCFQEHKLRGLKLSDFGHRMWNQALFFSCEASVGYGHNADQVGAGRGGLCMFISPKIRHLVHDQGTVYGNLAQWVLLKGTPGGDVAIVNIYAPNASQERILLWRELVNCLPQGYRWILGGDWNVVEQARDKSFREGRIISDVEKLELEILKTHLQVTDYFEYDQLLAYTWDNHRLDGARVLARLDMFYTFSSQIGAANRHVKEYSIQGDAGHSDHLPVTCTMELQQEKPQGARYKMNGAYLQDASVVLELKQRWSSYPGHLSFGGKMKRIIKWYKEMSINKAKARRFREAELRGRLSWAQGSLHLDPTNTTMQEEVDGIRLELKEYDEWKINGQNARQKLRRRAHGDKATKEFYEFVRFRPAQMSITELQDEGSLPHTGQEEMEKICLDFYSQLYTRGVEEDNTRISQATALESTVPKLSAEM